MNAVFTNQCQKCMTCVSNCGLGLLTVNEEGFPEIAAGMEDDCIHCSHCEAICPQSADKPLNTPGVTPEMLAQYMKMRRSIRRYQDQPVEKAVLNEIMDIVRYAPSGLNGQPLHWVIVHDTREVRRIADMVIDWMRQMVQIDHPLAAALHCPQLIQAYEMGNDVICRNAPHLVTAYGPKDAATDGTIALAHLDLAAPAFGLGACWAGFVQLGAAFSPEIKRELGIPEPDESLGCMMIGRPKHKFYQIPARNEAKIVWK